MLLCWAGCSQWAGSSAPRCCGAALHSSSPHSQLRAQCRTPPLPGRPCPPTGLVSGYRSGLQEGQEHGAGSAGGVGGAGRVGRLGWWCGQDQGALADLGVGLGLAGGRGLLFWNGAHWQSGMWEACIIVPAHTTPAPSQHDQPLAFMSNNIHPKFSKRHAKKKKLQGDTQSSAASAAFKPMNAAGEIHLQSLFTEERLC